MTKILVGGIQKFSTSDGPGIRTTVFVKGCPLHCRWCHNPELISFGRQLMRSENRCICCAACIDVCPRGALWFTAKGEFRIDREKCDNCLNCTSICYAEALRPAADMLETKTILETVLQDRDYYQNTGGGVTLSGGEILSHGEFALEFSKRCQEEGIRLVIDTSGYGNYELLRQLARSSQEILYDLKSLDDEIHLRYTGRSNEVILKNLRRLAAEEGIGRKIQIRMPLIHQVNDGRELIERTAVFLRENNLTSVTFLPYHELGSEKSQGIGLEAERFEPPSAGYLRKLEEVMRREGVRARTLGKNSVTNSS